ncbi:MAG: sigma-54 dependent transcriptional regulator [Spirochaetes bacterium]|nr:sigma-54 dependent transcriptional regulator [Spirochaetota bacterium]
MQEKTYTGHSIIIVDDEDGIRHGLSSFFKKKCFKVYATGNFQEALNIVKINTIDIAIVDIRLNNGKSGIDLLQDIKTIDPDITVIMITGYGSIDNAVSAMKIGAFDYIVKPIDSIKLFASITKSLEIKILKKENLFLKNELFQKNSNSKMITQNPKMKLLIEKADKIKNNPVTVLITGESGTGKEVFARYVHFTSNRKNENFVGINCAALSDSLLLSELFGHEKGAFTGAIDKKLGKFEIADGGTLFLDEIGDMSLDTQAKLLRVIEESSFERLGSNKKISVNIRLIAATNKDLKQLIQEGKFREDLYYRLNVISFELLPLRERKDDIPLLADHFINKCNTKYKKNILHFTKTALLKFQEYHWPGNIREFQNYINQIILLTDKEIIAENDLQTNIIKEKENNQDGLEISDKKTLKDQIEKVISFYEKKIIKKALLANKNNRTKTAQELNITRKTLRLKMNKYQISDE